MGLSVETQPNVGFEKDGDLQSPGGRRLSHQFSHKARKLMNADMNRVESFLDMSMLGGSIKDSHSFGSEHHQPWEIDLDKLVCKTVIASGTYGTVYKGVYQDKEVAIKVLDWGDNTTSRQQVAQLRKAFSQEVDVWKNLHHVNIVQFLGASLGASEHAIPKLASALPGNIKFSSNVCCVVVEYVGGGTLKDFLIKKNGKRLPYKKFLTLALGVAKGMEGMLAAFSKQLTRGTRARSSVQARAMSAPAQVEVSPPWQPALQDIVIEPTTKHTATVVFLHGLGDSGRGWADIVPAFGLNHIKWILPTAEKRPISINGGFPMNGWFDVRGLGPSTQEDVQGLDRAAAHVISLIAKEKAKTGPDSSVRYAVGGFSQGGSLALHTATTVSFGKFLDDKPAPEIPLAATVCISGWLSGSEILKGRKNVDAAARDRASRLPILHCHGTDDPVVNFQFGKLTADALKNVLGFSKAEFKSYRGVGHHVNPQEVADIRAWLLEHLPPA